MDARGNIRIIFEDVAENDRVIVAGFNDNLLRSEMLPGIIIALPRSGLNCGRRGLHQEGYLGNSH